LTIVNMPQGPQNKKQIQEEQLKEDNYMNITKQHYKIIICTCT